MTGKIEVYEDAACEWRWRLLAGNGRVVADSAEGYCGEFEAKRAARRARTVMAFSTIAVVEEDAA